MKEMSKHLVELLFVNAAFIFLVRERRRTVKEYNIKLIRQPTNFVVISAAAIGISIAAILISIVTIIMWNQNVMVVIAAVFISIGTGRQILATALDAVTTNMNSFLSSWASTLLLLSRSRLIMMKTEEWHSLENKIELILLSSGLDYNLPVQLDGVEPEAKSHQILLNYLNEHRWELDYQHSITDNDSSCLAFAHHTAKQMREKLLEYDHLEDLEVRSGGVHTIILIAIGTLIWLIS